MKIILVILCAGAIFLCTCTESLMELKNTYSASFVWNDNPNLNEIFSAFPAETGDLFWKQKMLHIVAFFILTFLLVSVTSSLKISVILAVMYALLTEVLQLFFNRGGRIFDVGFDSLGIIAALLFIGIIRLVATGFSGNFKKTH